MQSYGVVMAVHRTSNKLAQILLKSYLECLEARAEEKTSGKKVILEMP